MRPSVMLRAGLCAAACASACGRPSVPPAPIVVQVSGTAAVAGLASPVRVVRDRWGIPHVYAASQHDLFFAQGYVQAQERLFQMDLWRRSAQGRLAEVLGPNFIERDAMTRRVQFRGDLGREWDSYGADARAIAAAFVDGVNAWVSEARQRPPEEFRLAGWLPDLWSPDDLLNRTDGFDVRAAVDLVAQKGLNEIVADAIRRVGAAPFFTLLTGAVGAERSDGRDGAAGRGRVEGNRELVSPLALLPTAPNAVTLDGAALEVSESHRSYEQPAPRFLIHLQAPGWNVVGATSPWRPGVAVGHNEQFAWGIAPADDQLADIVDHQADPDAARVVTDAIAVKGREKPFEYQTEWTSDGVVVASDRQRGRHFVLQWRGFEPGTAPELAALLLDRAATGAAFMDAAARWQLPAGRVIFLGRDGQIAPPGRPGGTGRPGRGDPVGGTTREGSRRASRAVFVHPLAITSAARARFDVGPVARPLHDGQLRARFVNGDWDRSRIVNAPGQSESPARPHFSDLALPWSAGEMVPLAFSDAAVEASAESTLMLVPAGGAAQARPREHARARN